MIQLIITKNNGGNNMTIITNTIGKIKKVVVMNNGMEFASFNCRASLNKEEIKRIVQSKYEDSLFN